MKRFADIVIEKRVFFLIGIILLTLFFLYQAVFKLEIKTIFNDLLPKNHEYVNLHNEIRNPGTNIPVVFPPFLDRSKVKIQHCDSLLFRSRHKGDTEQNDSN